MKRLAVRMCGLAVVLALAVGLWWWLEQREERVDPLLTVYGNVDIRQVDVGFRISGRIAEQFVDEGLKVHTGRLLARLDPKPAEDALRRAGAELHVQDAELAKMLAGYRPEEVAQARAALRGSQGTLRNATSTLQRMERLYRGKAISRQVLDDARSAHTQALEQAAADEQQVRLMESGYRHEDIARQQASVDAARAALASAQLNVDDTELYAPQDGIIQTRVREVGAVVQAGQSVYALTLNKPVWIRAFVAQPQLGLVRPGQPVWLEVDAAPGRRFAGTVGFISPVAEFTPKTVETREVRNDLVFRFRIVAEDPEQLMRQGMPVTVVIPLNSPAEGVAIPPVAAEGTSHVAPTGTGH